MLIGFAGLGRMGAPMAQHLLQAGYDVIGYDPTLNGDNFNGIKLVSRPSDLLEAGISISMLPNGQTTEDLVRNGLADGNRDHLHVVMGTVPPTLVRELADSANVTVIDSPVSGSVSLAESKDLTTMTGGSDEQYERVQPVLEAMTKSQFHTGPVGTGATAKLAINSVLAVLSQGVAEALVLAERSGLDIESFYEVLRSSAVAAPYVQYKQEVYLHPGEAPVAAPISLIRKDVGLAVDVMNEEKLTLPSIQNALDVLDASIDDGLTDGDMGEVITRIRTMNETSN